MTGGRGIAALLCVFREKENRRKTVSQQGRFQKHIVTHSLFFSKLDSSISENDKKSQGIIEREQGFQRMRQRNMSKKAK